MSGRLIDSPGHVIGKLLRDLGLGTQAGGGTEKRPNMTPWQVAVDSELDRPDDVITVYNTAGRNLGFSMPDRERVTAYGLSLRVRCQHGSTGWDKVNAIAVAFDSAVEHNTVNMPADERHAQARAYAVGGIDRIGTVTSLGYEQGSKRRVWSFNAVVYIRQLS